MNQNDWNFAIVALLMAASLAWSMWSDIKRKRKIRAGEAGCEVCGTMVVDICMECCRCKNPRCNGGCIFCRKDLPFGRIVR